VTENLEVQVALHEQRITANEASIKEISSWGKKIVWILLTSAVAVIFVDIWTARQGL
jgi:hypothetical protein